MNSALSTEQAREIAAGQAERENAIEGSVANGQQDESEEKAAALIQVPRPRNKSDRLRLTTVLL